MKIAITQQESINEDVAKLVDYIELVHVDMNAVREFSRFNKPFLLHAQFPAGSSQTINLCDPDFINKIGPIKEIIGMIKTPYVSFHLGYCAEKVFSKGWDHADEALSSSLSAEQIVMRIKDNLKLLKLDIPILLENLDYNETGAYKHICDPVFIKCFFKDCPCDMLLDIGHMVVAAKNLGYSVDDYLEKLPLDKVVEIHMSKPKEVKEGVYFDSHASIDNEEIELVKKILEKAKGVEVICLETFGNPDELIRELELIRENFCH